jgi:hypothetical protein
MMECWKTQYSILHYSVWVQVNLRWQYQDASPQARLGGLGGPTKPAR